MGDRLTLETADESKAWLDIMAETCSTREADAAIRAYRERLPDAGDDIPRDYITAREQLPRLVGAILNPNGEQEAYCLDPVGTIASVDAAIAEVERLRGPTEGASDAAFMASAGAIHEAVSWLLALGADSTQLNAAAIEKLAAHTVREYAVERAGEIGQWAAHDDSAKLGTLIGAVEDETGLLRDWVGVIGDRDPGVTAALTAIADRLDEAAQVCRECGRPLSVALELGATPPTLAPQVPDSPGWWWHRDDCMHVSVCQGGPNEGKLVYKYGLADGDGWGGRCTRGAPDGNTSSSDGLGEE